VLRGISEVGLDVPVGVSASNLIYAEMKQFATILRRLHVGRTYRALRSIRFRRRSAQRVREYADSFKATGVHADVAQAIGWDPALYHARAFKKLGLNASATISRRTSRNCTASPARTACTTFAIGSQRGLTDRTASWSAGTPDVTPGSRSGKFGGAPLR